MYEPAAGDGRGEHRRHATGAEADDHAPEKVQLPGRRHDGRQEGARGNGDQRANGDAADAESIHQRSGEGPCQPEQEQVDEDGKGDDRAVPPEFVLEWNDQDPGRRAKPCRPHQGNERDRGDDPGVVDALQWVALRGQPERRLAAISLAWRAASAECSREAVTMAPSIRTASR